MIITTFKILKFVLTHPLNKKRKIKAAYNFFSWQLNSRMTGKRICSRFINDSSFLVARGQYFATANFYCGLAEFEMMTFLLHYLRQSDQFVDVGANVGIYTVLASKGVGCFSFSFEPDDANFKQLQENIRLNKISSLVRENKFGLSDKEATLNFLGGQDSTSRIVGVNGSFNTSVQVKSADSIADLANGSVLKIDVEGHEQQVINGAKQLLKSTSLQVVIIELRGHGECNGQDEQNIVSQLGENGFVPVTYDPFARQLILDTKTAGDFIFVRDIEHANDRVKTADSAIIHHLGEEVVI